MKYYLGYMVSIDPKIKILEPGHASVLLIKQDEKQGPQPTIITSIGFNPPGQVEVEDDFLLKNEGKEFYYKAYSVDEDQLTDFTTFVNRLEF